MKRSKKVLFCLFLIISITTFIYPKSSFVKADSGWDSGYGGDSGGGSSWSSSGGSSSSSGSNTETSLLEALLGLTIGISIFALVVVLTNKKNIKAEMEANIIKRALSDDYIKYIDPDIDSEEIVMMTFNLYKKVQIAWMNFDYETLEDTLTDELYNNYKMLLETLSLKGEKNIMDQINLINGSILKIQKDGDKETIEVGLNVSQLDYVINESNNEITHGSKSPKNITYKITIVRDKSYDIKYCPSCGAKQKSKNHQLCPYCNSVIVTKSNRFVISKKEVLKQK